MRSFGKDLSNLQQQQQAQFQDARHAYGEAEGGKATGGAAQQQPKILRVKSQIGTSQANAYHSKAKMADTLHGSFAPHESTQPLPSKFAFANKERRVGVS